MSQAELWCQQDTTRFWKSIEAWSAVRGSNPGPPPCQGGALTLRHNDLQPLDQPVGISLPPPTLQPSDLTLRSR